MRPTRPRQLTGRVFRDVVTVMNPGRLTASFGVCLMCSLAVAKLWRRSVHVPTGRMMAIHSGAFVALKRLTLPSVGFWTQVLPVLWYRWLMQMFQMRSLG